MTEKRIPLRIIHVSATSDTRLILKIANQSGDSVQSACEVKDIFFTIKSLTAELNAPDWKIANQIKSMDREAFSQKFEVTLPLNPTTLGSEDPNGNPVIKELLAVLKSLTDKTERQDGIANLVEKIQADHKEDQNGITALVEKMYDSAFAWNPESQGSGKSSGKAWGAEFDLRTTHAVGSWFIEGFVGIMKMRIFKTHSTVQVYLTTMDHSVFDMSQCDKNFSVNNKEEFFTWIKELAKRQAQKQES